jgi:hypothetical protein
MTVASRYEAIALGLRNVRPDPNDPLYAFWRKVVESIADSLQADNRALQRERFYREAGYTD